MTAEITLSDHPDGTDYRILVRHGDPGRFVARPRPDLGFADGLGLGHQAARRCRGEPGRPMKLTLHGVRHPSTGSARGPGLAGRRTRVAVFGLGGWLVPYLDELFVRRTSDWLELADGPAARAADLPRRFARELAPGSPTRPTRSPGRMNSLA